MKHEWRKHEKGLYGAKKTPALLDVPLQNYIMVSGKGNPNETDFSNRIEALYSLAYAIKMDYKSAVMRGEFLNDVHDFSVYPLEGVWKQKEGDELVKEKLEYTLMIRQPGFITKDAVNDALERVKKKKPIPFLEEIQFDRMKDGVCVEILHIGAFDEEPASFEKMEHFTRQNGLERIINCHREIYLNNAKRVPKNKLQTILRYQVKYTDAEVE